MAANWQYFYEPFTRPNEQFFEHFNSHLNDRGAEGWELVSAQMGLDSPRPWAALIWRR